jgi:hypothetical protein
MHAGEIDDVADVIAELRSLFLGNAQAFDHLIGDMALKFPVLHAAGIADDMKPHLLGLRDRRTDRGKIVREVVAVGRQSKRARQRLVARVAMGDRIERRNAAVRLRLPGFGTRSDGAPVPGMTSFVTLDQNRTPAHFPSPLFEA